MSENKNSINEITDKDINEKSNDWGDSWLIIALMALFSWGNGKDPEKEMLKERVAKLEGEMEMLKHFLAR
ncbi:MAG: hypothetical protein NC131_01130 [Roseburia sp.]|nr:hypothetical protein [Roseburia sp.]